MSKKESAEMKAAKKNGMRFWLRGYIPGMPPEYCRPDEPFPEKGFPSEFFAPKIEYHGRKLKFIGEIYIDNADVARAMMADGGGLRFNPQDAVDILGIAAEEIRDMGYDVRDGGGTAAPAQKPKEPLPNLHAMTKDELIAFADSQGLFLSKKLTLDDMIKGVKKFLKEKEKE